MENAVLILSEMEVSHMYPIRRTMEMAIVITIEITEIAEATIPVFRARHDFDDII